MVNSQNIAMTFTGQLYICCKYSQTSAAKFLNNSQKQLVGAYLQAVLLHNSSFKFYKISKV